MPDGDLILHDAFVQLDTVRGYRAKDQEGAIANRWSEVLPEVQFDGQGLLMVNRDSSLRELRVNALKIWIHFYHPASVNYTVNQSRRIAESTCEMIDVASCKRFGFRLRYLFPVHDPVRFQEAARNKVLGAGINDAVSAAAGEQPTAFAVVVRWLSNNLSISLRLSPVERAPGPVVPVDLPDNALMIDVDLAREGSLPVGEFKGFMRAAQDWLDDSLPNVAVAVLPEVRP